MSQALFVVAVLLVFGVGGVALCRCFPRTRARLDRAVFGEEPAEELTEEPVEEPARPVGLIRPAVPPAAQWRPVPVAQTPAAFVADEFRMTREERDRFELAVAVYRHVPAGRLVDVRPEESR